MQTGSQIYILALHLFTDKGNHNSFCHLRCKLTIKSSETVDSCQLPRSTSEQQQQQAQENERTARKDIFGTVVDATPA